MKSIAFYTIHQAPHNTYTFKCLENDYNIKVFYLKEKLSNYRWRDDDFYYLGERSGGIIKYLQIALRSDLSVISGWQSYKYILLITTLLILRKRFAIYLDMDIRSLKKYGRLKKLILKLTPVVFITGTYGERFLKRYLKKIDVYNFPYGVKTFSESDVINMKRERNASLLNGDPIRVFISNRFIDRKGYHLVRLLLTALKERGLLNEFRFVMAGDGPLFESERNLIMEITKDVDLLGWIDYKEYRANMLKTDVYLHCSDYEPYGIPPIDAFNCMKTIVLTNRVYSMYDIIAMGGKVYSFGYENPQELVCIFINIVRDKAKLYSSEQIEDLTEKPTYLFKNVYLNSLKKILPGSVTN